MRYSSYIRTEPKDEDIAYAIVTLMRYFKWKNSVIFFEDDSLWMSLAHKIDTTLRHYNFIVSASFSLEQLSDKHSIIENLHKISSSVKAIILCMDIPLLQWFMSAAHEIRMTHGKLAFLGLQTLFSGQSDIPPKSLESAYESLMLLTSLPYKDSGWEWKKWSTREEEFNQIMSNITENNTMIRNSVPQIFDTIFLLAKAISRTIDEGGVKSLSAESIVRNTRNLEVEGLNGLMRIKDNGDAIVNFALMDYYQEKHQFVQVLSINYSSVTSLPNVIHWPDIGGPEPDSDCDIYGTNCQKLTVGHIIAIVFSGAALAGIIALGAIFLRHSLLKDELAKGPNKVLLTPDDITFVASKSLNSSYKQLSSTANGIKKPDLLKSHDSVRTNSSQDSNKPLTDKYTTARYNGDLVVIKYIQVKGLEMKSKLMKEIKMVRELRHENVNSLVGWYIDSIRPALVYEFCTRESLEDVIANENIKLDWSFKSSLLTDLIRGMRYLHASSIHHHGYLKSRNCVIDSRWVLKVTDCGLPRILNIVNVKRNFPPEDLLWTSPELLRDPLLCQKGSQSGDIYGFAIIMQEIVMRGPPYCMLSLTPQEIIQKIKKPPPLIRPSVSQQAAPPEAIQVMKQCWSEMPEMRPDFNIIYDAFKLMNQGKKTNIVDTMFKMLEKYSNNLEDLIRERTEQLAEEKKKTDQLLCRMLPQSVAESLKTGTPVEAENYSEVTIYFSDIVGFTTISAYSTPIEVVQLLNDLYTCFDATIDTYDVYKVETIGDAYMVVSGLPDRNGNRHAGECATMALDLLHICGKFTIRHMPGTPLMLRIGLHTGPCVAGVVGLTMPRYCLFGDTVNTASRMESTGQAYRIHVSESTHDKLNELGGYHMDYRGETELKGKGKHKTYWLVGKDEFTKTLPSAPEGGVNHGLAEELVLKGLQRRKEMQQNRSKTNLSRGSFEA